MGRNLPQHVAVKQPATRVIHYADPVPDRNVVILRTQAEVEAWRYNRQRDLRQVEARNLARQAAIADRDRTVRRFMFGFGAVVAFVLLTALGFAVWLVWHYLAGLGAAGVLAIPVVLLILGGIAKVGHSCVTVVQHWH